MKIHDPLIGVELLTEAHLRGYAADFGPCTTNTSAGPALYEELLQALARSQGDVAVGPSRIFQQVRVEKS